ncbi:MAG TPA: c-type cytochrome [Gemmatimonadaceae bacterium]|nr:c-type cytochrome [Gemmatimonadaceae bacterium]
MIALRQTLSSVFVAGCLGGFASSVAGCADRDAGERPSVARPPVAQQQGGGGAAFVPASWRAPAESDIPNDSLGASVRRGLALITHTADSLPTYAPGNINCTNCHLNAGRNLDAAPLAGSHARFPKYLERSGAVVGLADRVNYCFTRSLAGSRLPADSREMQDILAYLAWLSRGVPVTEGKMLAGADGLAVLTPELEGDTIRGRQVYAAKCASCHQLDGQGNRAVPPGIPALWGPRSFSIGASMARRSKAASFIWNNMPLGLGKTLTPQEAFDVAAYVTSQPRPDSPGKERDWPNGGAPKDAPYATRGHVAFNPPRVLPRANPAAAIVDAPASVKRRGGQ